jgi:hypothetical protein
MLAGFALCLLGLLAVATCLYPGWPIGYLGVLQSQFSPTQYEYLTPTVHSLLSVSFGTTLGRYLWLVFLPAAIAIYARYGTGLDFRAVLNWAVIASVVTAPFGWASDQVVLLVPILLVVALALRCQPMKRRASLASLGLIFLFAWWFWVVDYQELPNLAVPLAIAALFGYLLLAARRNQRHGPSSLTMA